MPFRVVGVFGEVGSGKSTFAQRLADAYGFQVVLFAAPLKDLCAAQFGWDRSRLDELEYKEAQDPFLPLGWTRRRVLQHVGTEGFRAIDADYWAKRTAATIAQLRADGIRGVVVPDLRFPNEADVINAAEGVLVRLERAGGSRTASTAHASEQAWRNIEADRVYSPEEGVANVWAAADALMAEWNRYERASSRADRV